MEDPDLFCCDRRPAARLYGLQQRRIALVYCPGFCIGCFFSALAGYIGMRAATKANVRTAHAARTSLSKALKVSFTGGAVMGMGVAGLAVLGLGGLFIVLIRYFAPEALANEHSVTRAIEVLT